MIGKICEFEILTEVTKLRTEKEKFTGFVLD